MYFHMGNPHGTHVKQVENNKCEAHIPTIWALCGLQISVLASWTPLLPRLEGGSIQNINWRAHCHFYHFTHRFYSFSCWWVSRSYPLTMTKKQHAISHGIHIQIQDYKGSHCGRYFLLLQARGSGSEVKGYDIHTNMVCMWESSTKTWNLTHISFFLWCWYNTGKCLKGLFDIYLPSSNSTSQSPSVSPPLSLTLFKNMNCFDLAASFLTTFRLHFFFIDT